jgi:hypothetical protein
VLNGDLTVLAFKDDRTWRITVKRTTDPKEFREYVKELLSGGRLPKYARDGDDALYQKAVQAFQRRIAAQSDAELAPTLSSLKTGGFDPGFFFDHAESDPSFLFALANAYRWSGAAADAPKAVHITNVLLLGPQKLEEDSGDWWEAKTIQLDVRVTSAERALAASGASSPEAKEYAKQAVNAIVFMKQMHPRLGGAERRDVTLAEWKALYARLLPILGKVGIPHDRIDLTAEPPPPAATVETPPAPTAPAPETPGMDK